MLRFSVDPEQTGELEEAVGGAGVGLTTTFTVPAALVQPFTVTVMEYVPLAAAEALAILGFCNAEVNPLGPLQLYVAPTTAGVVSVMVLPTQTGELEAAVGVAGIGLITTVTVPAVLVHPATVTVTEYVPEAAVVTLVMEGFCKEEEKLLGPVQLYVAPATAGVVKFNVDPAQSGALEEAVGVAGVGFTVTATVPAALEQPLTVTITE